MAIFQSDWAKGFNTPVTAYNANGLHFVQYTYTFSTAFAFAADKVELGPLPAFCKIVDWYLLPENLNGNFTIGLMTGTAGVADNARTVGAELLSATALASALVRGALPAGFLIAPDQNKDRGIGLTGSADIVAAANKKITLGLMLYAG